MTEQEQKAFDLMREALKLCYEHCRVYHPEVDANNVGQSVRQALTAANAVRSEQEISRFKAVMLKHKDSACPLCDGTGEAQSVQKHPILQLWEDESQAIIDAGWTERTKTFAPQEK